MTRMIDLPDEGATQALAARIARALHPGDSVLLSGPLGAGKTALARAMLRTLADDPALAVPSPTYTLVQSYEFPAFTVHHFDLWRIPGPAGLRELGWDSARAGVVIVEWPDRLGALAPADALRVELTPTGPDARAASVAGWDGRL